LKSKKLRKGQWAPAQPREVRQKEDLGEVTVDQTKQGDGGGPTSDQLAWVREAIDGLRHSQNLLAGCIALLAAVFGGFMIWQAGEIKGVGDDIKAMRTEVLAKIDSSETRLGARIDGLDTKIGARIDSLDAKVTDTRERIIRLETQLQGVSEQLAKFQRGALEPTFDIDPSGNSDFRIETDGKDTLIGLPKDKSEAENIRKKLEELNAK